MRNDRPGGDRRNCDFRIVERFDEHGLNFLRRVARNDAAIYVGRGGGGQRVVGVAAVQARGDAGGANAGVEKRNRRRRSIAAWSGGFFRMAFMSSPVCPPIRGASRSSTRA